MIGNYFDRLEYYLENIWFRYDGIAYRGNGVLRWTPEDWFRIVAKIKGDSTPKRKEFRSIDFKDPVRVRLEIGSRRDKKTAITPFLHINDMRLLFWEPFSINFRRMVFFQHIPSSQTSKEKWFGSAMFETEQGLMFPDTLHREERIGDRQLRESFARAGFEYIGENGEKITGEIRDEKYLYFDWSLPKQSWTKERSWHFAEALQDALSIISGKVIRLRYHETYRNHRMVKEYNGNGDPSSLGLIFRFFDFDIVEKSLVVCLAIFLSQKSKNEGIIRKILWQLVDASKQNSQQASELLLSTILEAALRTLYDLPFVPGRPPQEDPFKKSLEILKRFQVEYLSGTKTSKWEEAVEKVYEAYRRLRHRNAHPDWLSTPMGMLSVPEKERTMNDMILLSRFYGYMILALSGIKELDPKFPAPISNWGPIMTMETRQS
jgi:hypothetical protein